MTNPPPSPLPPHLQPIPSPAPPASDSRPKPDAKPKPGARRHDARPDDAAADLNEEERDKATEEESIDAAITHEVVRREGMKELERAPSALAWSGLAAGLSMGLSLVTEGVLRSALPDTDWRPLVAKLGYAVGFLVVILGSQHLYTENTLTPVVPLMARRSGEMLRKVLVLWGVVLLANMVGAALVAWALAGTDAFRPEVRDAFDAIARESMEGAVGGRIVRAVLAGWIIALMVWMLPAAGSAKVLVIVLMAWLVGAGHLAHIVVGAVEMFYLVIRGGTSIGEVVGRHLLPTLLGNTLGGVALVAAVNHAQVVAGGDETQKAERKKRKKAKS